MHPAAELVEEKSEFVVLDQARAARVERPVKAVHLLLEGLPAVQGSRMPPARVAGRDVVQVHEDHPHALLLVRGCAPGVAFGGRLGRDGRGEDSRHRGPSMLALSSFPLLHDLEELELGDRRGRVRQQELGGVFGSQAAAPSNLGRGALLHHALLMQRPHDFPRARALKGGPDQGLRPEPQRARGLGDPVPVQLRARLQPRVQHRRGRGQEFSLRALLRHR
mmetsp:Transcript_6730/g.19038  ORF Transcript_6730/g.19038 Transcript_6730/m.19038 type:complete len:221 (+) Transcript_6730:1858-2520(+)